MNTCKACGELATRSTKVGREKVHYCEDCYAELFEGKTYIPKPRPLFGSHPNGRIEASENEYHGGRFSNGEW